VIIYLKELTNLAFEIPTEVKSAMFKTVVRGIDEAIESLTKTQKQLVDSPSSVLPNGVQDEDEIKDLEKNFEGIVSQLDGLLSYAEAQTNMRIDRSKL
jgi:soluble cytochrome b562